MNKEIMTENFPKITKEIKAQIQEAKRILSRINTTHTCLHTHTQTHPTQTIFKMLKTKYKDIILMAARGRKRHTINREATIKQTSYQKLCKAKNHGMTCLNY